MTSRPVKAEGRAPVVQHESNVTQVERLEEALHVALMLKETERVCGLAESPKPIKSGAMHLATLDNDRIVSRQRNEDVGLPCSNTTQGPVLTSTYAISDPATETRFFSIQPISHLRQGCREGGHFHRAGAQRRKFRIEREIDGVLKHGLRGLDGDYGGDIDVVGTITAEPAILRKVFEHTETREGLPDGVDPVERRRARRLLRKLVIDGPRLLDRCKRKRNDLQGVPALTTGRGQQGALWSHLFVQKVGDGR